MHDKIEWRFAKNPATERVLNEVEKELNIRLPIAYRELLTRYNGARPKPNVIHSKGKSNGKVVKTFLNIYPIKGGIRDVMSWLKANIPQNVIPFANDPFGNYICFDYRSGKTTEPTIVFWDHESRNTVYISGSFSHFLDELCGSWGQVP
ncbi:SMI1/KNR4 family protein [Halalkalibacter wakoensis]|uniref:SMI1/KNR4 family protein n=1 Tax=Halalkalibacter wakoensis TaxID=127891 RepID=UPI00068F1D99|nr:SMI1/KNR4 family protein [Halalkalibacter wakoensis]